MTHSRNKGRNAEREVELILQRHGFGTDRNLGGRVQVAGDLVVYGPLLTSPRPLAVEVRRRERIEVVKWSAEHEDSTPDSHLPLVAYRPSRQPWRVSMLLDDLLPLLGGES